MLFSKLFKRAQQAREIQTTSRSVLEVMLRARKLSRGSDITKPLPVDLEPVFELQDDAGAMFETSSAEAQLLKILINRHRQLTGSPRAAWILNNWSDALSRFIKVFPHEHKRVLGVSRSPKPYIPSSALAAAAQAEQVQHG